MKKLIMILVLTTIMCCNTIHKCIAQRTRGDVIESLQKDLATGDLLEFYETPYGYEAMRADSISCLYYISSDTKSVSYNYLSKVFYSHKNTMFIRDTFRRIAANMRLNKVDENTYYDPVARIKLRYKISDGAAFIIFDYTNQFQ